MEGLELFNKAGETVISAGWFVGPSQTECNMKAISLYLKAINCYKKSNNKLKVSICII